MEIFTRTEIENKRIMEEEAELDDFERRQEELREKERSLGGQLGEKKKKNLSEIDKARVRLEAAEKKRQAMMQAQKEKQSAGDKKGGAKKTDGGVSVSLIFV